MKDPQVFLFEIVTFCDEVMGDITGLDEAGFEADTRTQRAVSYCLLSIGEAVNRMQQDHPGFLDRKVSCELPWQDIVGMRHFLAQDYDRVDPATLLAVSRSDIRPLRDAAASALNTLPDTDEGQADP